MEPQAWIGLLGILVTILLGAIAALGFVIKFQRDSLREMTQSLNQERKDKDEAVNDLREALAKEIKGLYKYLDSHYVKNSSLDKEMKLMGKDILHIKERVDEMYNNR